MSDSEIPFVPKGMEGCGSDAGMLRSGRPNRSESNRWVLFAVALVSFFAGAAISCLISIGRLRAGSYELNMFQSSLLCMLLLAMCTIEEFVFRFVLYGLGRKLLARLKAPDHFRFVLMGISAVLFSLAHIRNPEVASAGCKAAVLGIYFIAGLYFVFVYDVSGALSVPFSVHLLNNVLSTFVVKSEYSSIAGGTSLLVSGVRPDSVIGFICELVPLAISAACVAYAHSKGFSGKK